MACRSPSLRHAHHLRDVRSWSIALSRLRSATTRLSFAFSSRGCFSSRTSSGSSSQYRYFQRLNVPSAIPKVRQILPTGIPAWCCLTAATICSTGYRLPFICRPPSGLGLSDSTFLNGPVLGETLTTGKVLLAVGSCRRKGQLLRLAGWVSMRNRELILMPKVAFKSPASNGHSKQQPSERRRIRALGRVGD